MDRLLKDLPSPISCFKQTKSRPAQIPRTALLTIPNATAVMLPPRASTEAAICGVNTEFNSSSLSPVEISVPPFAHDE